MELRAHKVSLSLTETFTIARQSRDVEQVVHVELEHDGIVGYGEGAPVDYWGETQDSMLAFLCDEAPALIGGDPYAHEYIGRRLAMRPGEQGAKMAIDGALHDWLGKRLGEPVWRLFGLSPTSPPTSYTIGIDSIEGTIDRTCRAQGYKVLKLKVGGADDLERLQAVRDNSPARIRIDGNEGWTLETARELMPVLVEMGVEFVEQPFPAADLDSFRALREITPRIPVIVDEGCKDLLDVARVAGYADGVNIKLAKSGGIREALRMIHAARALGLQIMLGCMIESELGIAAAAQIASLVDYVDLDGHLLISNSPFTGLGFRDGGVVASADPGLGVRPE
ncbi:MAG TPA: dipeptide epimerase [Thermoleophilaceae bacterium]|jgi:L-alanine-DL-glutamate epimerase-like enolase superfamily enzyme